MATADASSPEPAVTDAPELKDSLLACLAELQRAQISPRMFWRQNFRRSLQLDLDRGFRLQSILESMEAMPPGGRNAAQWWDRREVTTDITLFLGDARCTLAQIQADALAHERMITLIPVWGAIVVLMLVGLGVFWGLDGELHRSLVEALRSVAQRGVHFLGAIDPVRAAIAFGLGVVVGRMYVTAQPRRDLVALGRNGFVLVVVAFAGGQAAFAESKDGPAVGQAVFLVGIAAQFLGRWTRSVLKSSSAQ